MFFIESGLSKQRNLKTAPCLNGKKLQSRFSSALSRIRVCAEKFDIKKQVKITIEC